MLPSGLEAAGHHLVGAMWRGGALGTVAILLLVVFRRRPAQWRMATLGAALLAQLLLFVLPDHLTPIRWHVLPTGNTATLTVPRQVTNAEASELGMAAGTPLPAELEDTGNEGMMWNRLLGLVWLAGAAVALVRLLGEHRAVHRLHARGTAPAPECRAALAWACRAAGHRGDVSLRVSDRVSLPFSCGIRHPTIILPASSADWQPVERRAVLGHEVAHIAHGDLGTRVAMGITCAVTWCNPLVHRFRRWLEQEQEIEADTAAIGMGVPRADYVLGVVGVIRRGLPMAPVSAVAGLTGGPSYLHRRMRTALAGRRTSAAPRWTTRALFLIGPVGALLANGLTPRDWSRSGSGPTRCRATSGPALDRTRLTPDGRSEWDVTWTGDGCRVEWRVVGTPRIDGARGRIIPQSIADTVSLNVTGASGLALRVTLGPDGSAVHEVADVPSDEAPAWLTRFLVELDRHTGFAVAARYPELRSRGLASVLTEIDSTRGGHAGGIYLLALLRDHDHPLPALDPVLDLTRRHVTVDAVLADVLNAVIARYPLDDPASQLAVIDAITGLRATAARADIGHTLVRSHSLVPAARGRLDTLAR